MPGFNEVVARLFHGDEDKQVAAVEQYELYKAKQGPFLVCEKNKLMWAAARKMAGHKWFKHYVVPAAPELGYVGCRVLSKKGNATACEHNWSEFDWIWSKRRNRLKPLNAT